MSARENILDAYEELLLSEGERSATLDAVAARAEVSKGGLLYHFKSKDALVDGLLDRLTQRAEVDAEAMRSDPRGPAAYYVDTSVYAGSPLDRALVATARLAQDAYPQAREAIQAIHERWFTLILEEIGDRAVARAIVLLGDGLYYNAVLAGAVADDDVAGRGPRDRAELLEVVAALKAQVAAAAR